MVFCENLEYPEAPVLLQDGSWLIALMKMGNGAICRVSADDKQVEAVTSFMSRSSSVARWRL